MNNIDGIDYPIYQNEPEEQLRGTAIQLLEVNLTKDSVTRHGYNYKIGKYIKNCYSNIALPYEELVSFTKKSVLNENQFEIDLEDPRNN